MADTTGTHRLLSVLDLTEYEEIALGELLGLGRTTAPTLADVSGIPKARIYGVLDSLAEDGYIKVIPGRPKQFQSKPPADVLERAIENERQSYRQYEREIDDIREDFLAEFEPRYEQATTEVTPTEELFYVVDVGQPSERETRILYSEATDRIDVVTKSFEYFDRVESAVEHAHERDVDLRVLFLHPDHLSEANSEIQGRIVDHIREKHPQIQLRFSEHKLPLRGTIADPSMEYDSGKAVFQVEELDIPLHMRQAAVTESGSLVAAMERYFELIWDHESVTID